MTDLCMKVEVLAGTDITTAAQQMCDLATKLDVMIETNFNGIRLLVTPHSEAERIVANYFKEIRRHGDERKESETAEEIGS